MSTITTAPGLISIDPIQGLVDYVNDIKPFHTKIFQVLFEYVYTDSVNTTVTDSLQLFIDDNQTYIISAIDPSIANPSSIPANSFWYDSTNSTLYLRGNYLNPTFVVGSNIIKLPGDQTSLFVLGFVFNINGTLTVNDGDYTILSSSFDGTNTVITTSPNPINGTPGASIFVPIGLNLGTYYWNGHQLFIINGASQTLIPNIIVQTSPPPYGSISAYWFNPTTNQLWSWNGTAYVPAIVYAGAMGYWIQFLTNVGTNPNPSTSVDTSVTEFIETIEFGWGGDEVYLILSSTPSLNQITISGNQTTALKIQDTTEINGNFSFITDIAFDLGSGNTVITLDSLPSVGSSLTVQNIDITYWYQFSIIAANPSSTLPSQSPLYAGIEFNTGTNTFFIPGGNFTSMLTPGIVLAISNTSTTNDGDYQVLSSSFVGGNTTVAVTAYGIAPGVVPFVSSTSGTARVITDSSAKVETNTIVVNIQNLINPSISLNIPSITLLGDATTSIQVGAAFQIQGAGTNDGVFTAVYVQYEPIQDLTTVGVQPALNSPTSAINSSLAGGLAVPYRFINESLTGSYDNTGYDTGSYDQSAGSIIYQGP